MGEVCTGSTAALAFVPPFSGIFHVLAWNHISLTCGARMSFRHHDCSFLSSSYYRGHLVDSTGNAETWFHLIPWMCGDCVQERQAVGVGRGGVLARAVGLVRPRGVAALTPRLVPAARNPVTLTVCHELCNCSVPVGTFHGSKLAQINDTCARGVRSILFVCNVWHPLCSDSVLYYLGWLNASKSSVCMCFFFQLPIWLEWVVQQAKGILSMQLHCVAPSHQFVTRSISILCLPFSWFAGSGLRRAPKLRNARVKEIESGWTGMFGCYCVWLSLHAAAAMPQPNSVHANCHCVLTNLKNQQP